MFGREGRLPIDSIFDNEETRKVKDFDHQDFVSKWKKSLEEACEIAKRNSRRRAASGKQRYDKRIFGNGIQVGDRVLVKNVSERGGTGKLRSYWEKDIYVVEKENPDIPVYHIKREDGMGRTKVLHRNLLQKCEQLMKKPSEAASPIKMRPSKKTSELPENSSSSSDSDSDEERKIMYLMKKLSSIKKKRRGERRKMKETPEKVSSPDEDDPVETNDDDRGETNIRSRKTEAEETTEEEEMDDHGIEANISESAQPEPRKSTRKRTVPKLLTYDKKGNTYYSSKPFRLRPHKSRLKSE